MLIESKVDDSKAQNLILTSVILIIGVSGAKGMALAIIVGVGLSIILISYQHTAPRRSDAGYQRQRRSALRFRTGRILARF